MRIRRRGVVIYAQIKRGRKLHLAFEAEGFVSAPVCGQRWDGHYRMTINVPLGNACKNCRRIMNANGGKKVKRRFLNSIMGTYE